MPALSMFEHAKDTVRVAAGDAIIHQGEPGDLMYVMVRGEARLVVDGETVENIGPGAIIGEMALISDAPRSASAFAITDCDLVPIDKKRFLFLVNETPFFSLQVMTIMAERLRHMNVLHRQKSKSP